MFQGLLPVEVGNGFRPNASGEEVLEIPLLLPGWQVTALATAAHRRGQTAGELVRDLLREFLADYCPDGEDHFHDRI
jgi:hypothetical protein